ncbi:unnamed protein product [Calypogeia fissa]
MTPSFTPNIGADGLATDVPIISYTEKVLEEKELKLKQYIQDNYSKIRNVEKELATLALEVKLTAGPKKLALEHLRKKIETATEKIKAAKLKEQQAKKVWEVADKALQAEEGYKQSLCEDLNRLVQESAAAQYSRLEDLSKRLEALNPDLKGTAAQLFGIDNSTANSSQQSLAVDGQQSATGGNHGATLATEQPQVSKEVNGNVSEPSPTNSGTDNQEKRTVVRSQHVSLGRGRGRTSGGRARGALVLQGSKPNAAGGWTGAGFDVDENS